ncbi:hypothetical protein PA7_02910 [Pseudonocardia asaccharolytica DSM 44247 = NBRC 16224]|uniref:DUF4328 domain-containing protein n=1 Tax=Pseudonocardia asaccharolytica DSM 44247 = NBRC 16224 TaxID=1123024 RepID=A0A511CYX6_9PSEU|nr:hypothetical protein PA7_02910 [Pseudonocardia asaccharolytica DSM 44247 = NBRC 16224]
MPPRGRSGYAGPPRYQVPPLWGFPVRPWGAAEQPDPPRTVAAVRSIAHTATMVLWVLAVVAVLAAGAEAWRYGLLVASRSGALAAGAVAASDMLVVGVGWFAAVLGLVAGVLVVCWSVRAQQAAAERGGYVPSRSPRAMVLGWVVPGVNLSVPGAVLAEIEHGGLDRAADARPRPSRLLLIWWALWVAGLVLTAVVLAWSFRSGVQAMADGVVLHAVLDLVAAATAVVTALVVHRLTRLLEPPREMRREVLVAVYPPATHRSSPRHPLRSAS